VPGVARATDEPELVACFAPKPALFISTSKDWTAEFPKDEFPKIRAVWGAPERVENRHHDVPHDYNQAMREQMYAFFNRWLKGSDDDKEPPLKTEPPQMLVWLDHPPAGHKGGAGVKEYYRANFTFKRPPTRDDVRALLGETGVEDSDEKSKDGTYPSEKGISIPALLFTPKHAKQAPAAIVIGKGKPHDRALADDLVARGFVVLAPDVRLFGELAIKWHLNAVIWGRPEAGMGAHDVKRAVDWLASRPDVDPKRICVVGLGDAGVVALLAGAIDERIRAVAADDIAKTYRDGREQPVIPNVLRVGDLPEIAALVARVRKPDDKAIAEWLAEAVK